MSSAFLKDRRTVFLSNAQRVERRTAACARIRELLAVKPMSVGALAADLTRTLKVTVSTGTVYGYLRFMAELGEARRAGKPGVRQPLWELGQEAQQHLEIYNMRPHGPVIVPAVQVGMQRDDLVAALFGPAGPGAAA